jgi:hypothetical protein
LAGTQFNDLIWRNPETAVLGLMRGNNNRFGGVVGILPPLSFT